MDPSALVGLCALLARGEAQGPLPGSPACPAARVSAPASHSASPSANLAALMGAPIARDAIARVAYAEAGNQGDSGLAGVVYTILNRLQDGRWGASVDSVLNARSQFEPVMRAGGDWRRLAAVSPAAQARVDTILNLALGGRLPDLTNGARYFQNPVVVARRAAAGSVSASLVDFGGSKPSAAIGAHRFYAQAGRGGRPPTVAGAGRGMDSLQRRAEGVFVGENRASEVTGGTSAIRAVASEPGDPARALFVTAAGRIRADHP